MILNFGMSTGVSLRACRHRRLRLISIPFYSFLKSVSIAGSTEGVQTADFHPRSDLDNLYVS